MSIKMESGKSIPGFPKRVSSAKSNKNLLHGTGIKDTPHKVRSIASRNPNQIRKLSKKHLISRQDPKVLSSYLAFALVVDLEIFRTSAIRGGCGGLQNHVSLMKKMLCYCIILEW